MFVAPQPAYFRVKLDPPPKIISVRTNRKENFRHHYNGRSPHVFEINYIQEGNLCEMHEDGEYCYEQGTVHTLADSRVFDQYSTKPVLHEFLFYVVSAVPPEPISEQEVADWVCNGNEAILPEYVTEPSLCRKIGSMLKEQYALIGKDPLSPLRTRGCFYECLHLLTHHAINQAKEHRNPKTKIASPYTKKACQFIDEHLNKKLTVSQISKASGTSYNHLKNVFRSDTGMSIVEYVNHARIRITQQLLTTEGCTLEEAGGIVGIPDPTYLSRMFRQYTGMTVHQYRQLHRH